PFRGGRWWPGREMGMGVPAVDVFEDKGEIVAKADLPGIEKDEVEVNISDHRLTIRGEKKKEQETKEENYYYAERTYGSFSRTIELPKEVDTAKAKAIFKNGVLEVRIPKTEEAKRKETKIKVD
ncbi:MAG TPA: Hsp20/alpha crystallin family protein, partial [Candidatus Binatia bacterium]